MELVEFFLGDSGQKSCQKKDTPEQLYAEIEINASVKRLAVPEKPIDLEDATDSRSVNLKSILERRKSKNLVSDFDCSPKSCLFEKSHKRIGETAPSEQTSKSASSFTQFIDISQEKFDEKKLEDVHRPGNESGVLLSRLDSILRKPSVELPVQAGT